VTRLLLLDARQGWECPNCDVTDVTRPLPPGASRFHTCAGLHMLTAPLIRAGVACKVVAEERADYLNGEVQNHGDDGKPYMAVRTVRDDGEDLAVNAGLARMGGGVPAPMAAPNYGLHVGVRAGLAAGDGGVPR